MPLRIGIIGCGHWGQNYVRVFNEIGAQVVEVADPRRAALAALRSRHPLINTTTDHRQLIRNDGVDAVVVATPATTHAAVACEALEAGKHVLVEKPMATTVPDARRIIATARARRRTLMVGHTFIYNDSVRMLRTLARERDTGRLYYLEAKRSHLGTIRNDVNALWDLSPHDLSIFRYVVGRDPEWVTALGGAYLRKGREDVAFMTLGYPGGVIGHIHVSWIDSNKMREVAVIGSHRRIVFDDLDALESVRIFEKGLTPVHDVSSYGEFQYLLRDGEIRSPKVERREPLRNLCLAFVDSVVHGKRTPSEGEDGLRIVETLVAADQSLRAGGRKVLIRRSP